jgi:hypothetical protein
MVNGYLRDCLLEMNDELLYHGPGQVLGHLYKKYGVKINLVLK